MSDLPDATPQNPACGVCKADTTQEDGWSYECHPCKLTFDPDTLQASFLNPGDPVCGRPCDNYWHGDNKIRPGRGYDCGTCRLPAGHDKLLCWTGCKPVEVSP